MANVFVSHSSLDNAQAQALFDWLQDQGHEQIFLDVDTEAGIFPGEDWERRLYQEIDRSQAVIVLLTRNWMASKWCFAEFTHARALGKKIFPVIDTPEGERLVGSDLQAIDLTSEREGGLERLSRAIAETALASPHGFRLREGISPFPGLDAFGEEQAAVFFGRDDAINALMERCRHARAIGGGRFIPILGGSGSGKSSLLRAGLLPRLKRDRANWRVLKPLRLEGDPVGRLARSLASAAIIGDDPEDHDRRATLTQALVGDAPGEALYTIATEIRDRAGQPDAGILVALDQLEEVFTLAPDQECSAFFAFLGSLLSPDLPFYAVATMRSEFLGALQAEADLPDAFEPYSLRPMPLERLDQLVAGPARVAGIEVEDAMLAALRSHVQSTDALPLVAFTLRRLFEAEKAGGRMTLAGYRALGEGGLDARYTPIENAIRQVAEAALPSGSDRDGRMDVLRSAFVDHLVTLDFNGNFVRTLAPDAQLEPARAEIDRLVAARLLVRRASDEGAGGDAVVEVAHEALFKVWDRLAGWLGEEKDFLTGRTLIRQQLAYTDSLPADQRDRGLLRDVLLDRARAWIKARPQAFDEDERAYIQTSIDQDDARRQAEADRKARIARLQRFLAIGSSAAALVFLVLGGIAYWQRTVATQALDAGTETANQVVIELARGFRDREGMRTDLVGDVLESAIGLHRDLAALGGDTPVLRAQTGAALTEIALAHLQSGSARSDAGIAAAKAAASEAVSLIEPLASVPGVDAETQAALVAALLALGDALRREGSFDQAEGRYSEALEVAEEFAEPGAADFEAARALALTLNRVGDMRMRAGDTLVADGHYRRSLSIREALRGALDAQSEAVDETGLIRDLAISHAKLADVLIAERDFRGADEAYQTSLGLRAELVAREPDNTGYRRDLAAGHQLRGRAAFNSGDFTFARRSFSEAESVMVELLASDPGRAEWREDLGVVLENLADVDLQRGALQSARSKLADVIELFRALHATDPSNAEWEHRLGVALLKAGDAEWQAGNRFKARDQLSEARDRLGALAEDQPQAISVQRSFLWVLLTISATETDPVSDLEQARDVLNRLESEGLLNSGLRAMQQDIDQRLAELDP